MVERKIYSMLSGEIINIEKVMDPVFSEKMLGDGIAIKPSEKKQTIVAPCDGTIQTLNSSYHALALVTADNMEVLIHIGIDTVNLKGEGFKPFIKVGDKVKKGDPLIEVDFPLIVKKVPSIDVILVVTNLSEDMELSKTNKNTVSEQELLCEVLKKGEKASNGNNKEESSEEVVSDFCTIINISGIHARPASFIFQIANKYQSKIELKKDQKLINAKSIVAILGLGLKYEDKIQIVAKGNDAKLAIDEIQKAIADGLGEGNSHVKATDNKINNNEVKSSNTEKANPSSKIIKDFSKEITITGVAASPGLVVGKAYLVKEEVIDVVENSSDKDSELAILEDSIYVVEQKVNQDIANANEKKQVTKVEIFNAHLTILKDESLVSEAKKLIALGKTAGFAWKQVIKDSIEVLHSTKNKLLIERTADFKDIEKRVLKAILGIDEKPTTFPKNSIIIAKDLVPSDVAKLDENVVGVILGLGSSTSHVSLMLRNMGTPVIVAIGEFIMDVKNDTDLILDANEGLVTVNPEATKLQTIVEKQAVLNKVRVENISNCKKPATTVDGLKILVKGNVSNGREAYKALDLGAEGVGLLRTEFLFFNSSSAPDESTQHNLYQEALDSMEGGSVTLRTLDVGGDKPLAYVEIGHEENPILGMRGVRNYFTNKEVFLTQIRAILKVKPLFLCKVMIPMVANIQEIIDIKKIIEEEKAKLGIKEKIEVGTMIEVPSAALIAEQMSKYVDFFSIGTNDLAQYTLAMDRGNSNLTAMLKNLHPAILKLIKITVDGGNKNNIPTAVCGAMASEIRSIPLLIGLGVKELSTSMKSIPDVKALIRTLSAAKCKEVAEKALLMESAEMVEALVKQEFNI